MNNLGFLDPGHLPVFKAYIAIISGMAAIVSGWAFARAYRMHRRVSGDLRDVAVINARNEFILFSFQLALFGIRLWATSWPIETDLIIARDWMVDVLIVTPFQVLLAYNSVSNSHTRKAAYDRITTAMDRWYGAGTVSEKERALNGTIAQLRTDEPH